MILNARYAYGYGAILTEPHGPLRLNQQLQPSGHVGLKKSTQSRFELSMAEWGLAYFTNITCSSSASSHSDILSLIKMRCKLNVFTFSDFVHHNCYKFTMTKGVC